MRLRRSKYGNKKVGGYDSLKERRRAFELRLLEKKGVISALCEQVKFELIPAQYEGEGKKRKCIERACSYVADFIYKDINDNWIVEDAKGMLTDVYRIKRKLMLIVHGIKIKEV